ncbi:MAG: NUDIX hydrolase [Candidatus Binataceae bacterium]
MDAEVGPNSHREAGARSGAPRRQSREVRPKVAVDVVLFAMREWRLKCYLVQLRSGPAAGRWAFPGRLIRVGELLDEAARGELELSTGIRASYLEQLRTFGDPTRDPQAHVVSVGYLALSGKREESAGGSQKYSSGQWFEIAELPPLAYDHGLMAACALERLKSKLEYTNIACSLLPQRFTFAEVEEVYETVLARDLDRRNLRRRIFAMGLLRQLPETRRGQGRPAALYEFVRGDVQAIEML